MMSCTKKMKTQGPKLFYRLCNVCVHVCMYVCVCVCIRRSNEQEAMAVKSELVLKLGRKDGNNQKTFNLKSSDLKYPDRLNRSTSYPLCELKQGTPTMQ